LLVYCSGIAATTSFHCCVSLTTKPPSLGFAFQELFSLEDLVADYAELKTLAPGQLITEHMIHTPPFEAASKLCKLVGLSASMQGDAAFSRQARRKYV
jgi:hypothetical protein